MNATRAIPAKAETAAPTPARTDLAAKIAAAHVNPGWRPQDWAARLRQLAERCEAIHPERAADLRAWAEAVEAAHPKQGGLDQ